MLGILKSVYGTMRQRGTATEEKAGAKEEGGRVSNTGTRAPRRCLVLVEEKVQRGGREGGEKVRKPGSSSHGRLCGSEGKREFVFRQRSQ